MVPDRLTCAYLCMYRGPPGAPDHISHDLLRPERSDLITNPPTIRPWPHFHASCHPRCSWWGKLCWCLWIDTGGLLTALPLIFSPGSSLTHDNLISEPRGGNSTKEATQPPIGPDKWRFCPAAIVGAGVFHIVPVRGRYIHPALFLMSLSVMAASQNLTR